jgi:hypothetical protein
MPLYTLPKPPSPITFESEKLEVVVTMVLKLWFATKLEAMQVLACTNAIWDLAYELVASK